ncbi:MAG TPA: hypothetical protein VN903_28680 [Polyangia bacterium]|nr:hypothetical protein [Polyangia bacterium]
MKTVAAVTRDFTVADHWSIVLLFAINPAVTDWIDSNVSPDAMYFGAALAIERRYAADIIDALRAEGFASRDVACVDSDPLPYLESRDYQRDMED